MPLVDLSQSFTDGMFTMGLFERPVVEQCVFYAERGVNVTRMQCAVHTGTHLDAPLHFVPGGQSIADLPLDRVCGRAVGWEVSRRGGEPITVADLEANRPRAEPGDMVFINTGWGPHFVRDWDAYRFHPYLSTEAAGYLVERGVKLVAFDLPTPDMPEPVRPAGFAWPVHHTLLEAGVLIAEHCASLHLVVGRSFTAYAFPLPITGADGSPVRMVAEL